LAQRLLLFLVVVEIGTPMFIHIWYFLTLTLTSLLMGTSFAHTLEMPAKMNVDGQLWRTFQHTLYPYFAYVGAPVEIGAIVTAAVLSYLVRADRPAFYLALAGTICLALAFFVVWLGFTNPVNAETAKWTHLRFRRTGIDGVANGNTRTPRVLYFT
jgi:hypothetical protein